MKKQITLLFSIFLLSSPSVFAETYICSSTLSGGNVLTFSYERVDDYFDWSYISVETGEEYFDMENKYISRTYILAEGNEFIFLTDKSPRSMVSRYIETNKINIAIINKITKRYSKTYITADVSEGAEDGIGISVEDDQTDRGRCVVVE